MKRLVVVGGGISGLAAAHEAASKAADVDGGLEVLVLEREAEIGGKARSLRDGNWLVESGPSSYLDSEPAFDRLVCAVGLGGQKLVADPAAARRYIVRRGRPREVAVQPLRFATARILGPWGLLRLLAEPLIPRGHAQREESIWQFARRRFGLQVADRLVAPMLLGIYAGDARRLSFSACFPQLAAFEQRHGSLFRAMLAKRREHGQQHGPRPSGRLTSFADGLQTLPKALAADGRFTVRCNAAVRSLSRRGSGFRLQIGDDPSPVVADAVILAGEAWATAEVLEMLAPSACRNLRAITTPPVAVVALGYPPSAAQCIPRGFGVLIPRNEGYRMLGCLWESYLYPRRAPEGHVLVRAMIGGSQDPEVLGLDDDALFELVHRELTRLFGVVERPVFERLIRWGRAIPQYELGHAQRVEAILDDLRQHPGLFVAGNALAGISFPRSALSGIERGEQAIRFLAAG